MPCVSDILACFPSAHSIVHATPSPSEATHAFHPFAILLATSMPTARILGRSRVRLMCMRASLLKEQHDQAASFGDCNGDTAIHSAAERGRLEAAQDLGIWSCTATLHAARVAASRGFRADKSFSSLGLQRRSCAFSLTAFHP